MFIKILGNETCLKQKYGNKFKLLFRKLFSNTKIGVRLLELDC